MRKKEGYEVLNTRIRKDLKERIDDLSERSGKSVRQVVEEALEWILPYIEKKQEQTERDGALIR